MPIKEIGRKRGFSDASFYKWRSKYGGMDASEAKRLRELELENGKLKRLLVKRTWTSVRLKAFLA
jgi:putative transposase